MQVKEKSASELMKLGVLKNTRANRRTAAAERTAALVADPDVKGEFVERTSSRWLGRTKGMPYSRCQLLGTFDIPVEGAGKALALYHPTRGRMHVKRATPELLDVYYPSLPDNIRGYMLGRGLAA